MMFGYGAGGDYWFGHTLFGGFFMLIVWAAVFLFFIWIVRELSGKNRGEREGRGENGKPALDILKERYAKGEITKEQFEVMKKDIAH